MKKTHHRHMHKQKKAEDPQFLACTFAFGERPPAPYLPVTAPCEYTFLVNNRVHKFINTNWEDNCFDQTITTLMREVTVNFLLGFRRDPAENCGVCFDNLDMGRIEHFINNDEDLEAAIWSAGIVPDGVSAFNLSKMRAFLPHFKLDDGPEYVRVLDCTTLIRCAWVIPELNKKISG